MPYNMEIAIVTIDYCYVTSPYLYKCWLMSRATVKYVHFEVGMSH